MSGVTHILEAIKRGDPKAADELLPLVYAELRKLAASKMARESPGHTLQPTALVHEALARKSSQSMPLFRHESSPQVIQRVRPIKPSTKI